MKPMILVTAPVQTRSGYGNHARDICRALIESDKYDVKIQSVPWGSTPLTALDKDDKSHQEIQKRLLRQPTLPKQPELHLHIVIPNEFTKFGKKNIGMTAGIESTVPPAEWVQGCNRMDKVIFTSEFSKTVFEGVGFDQLDDRTKQKVGELKLEKPTDVLFEGADTDLYKETNDISDKLNKKFSIIEEDFCFLFVGHWLQGNLGEDRKDIGMMIKTFFTTFKNMDNPPALILKTSGANFSIIDRNDIKKKINDIKGTFGKTKLPNLYLLHGDLTDEEMNEMYNHPKVKAHVSFTHGEGFGRPLLEASFSGKPIIAPISTGQADFLDKDYTIEIPHKLTKVPPNSFPKGYTNPESQWSTVNYGIASRLMSDVFQNYDKYKVRGKKQMIVNRENFSFEAMKEKLVGMVDEILGDVPKQVELKLPTLKKEPKKLKLPKLKKG
tara:strand:- start:270 stop:1586 length:1317 start_codon:yes stop_codon:yes gene_type:complete